MSDYDLWVDFTRMLDDGRLRTNLRHDRPGVVPVAGHHAIVGGEDADPAVAMILSVDQEAAIEVQVLPGTVDDNRSHLTPRLSGGAAGGGRR